MDIDSIMDILNYLNDQSGQSTYNISRILNLKCDNRFKPLGFIPRDPEFERASLEGTLSTTPGALHSIYYRKLSELINNMIK